MCITLTTSSHDSLQKMCNTCKATVICKFCMFTNTANTCGSEGLRKMPFSCIYLACLSHFKPSDTVFTHPIKSSLEPNLNHLVKSASDVNSYYPTSNPFEHKEAGRLTFLNVSSTSRVTEI